MDGNKNIGRTLILISFLSGFIAWGFIEFSFPKFSSDQLTINKIQKIFLAICILSVIIPQLFLKLRHPFVRFGHIFLVGCLSLIILLTGIILSHQKTISIFESDFMLAAVPLGISFAFCLITALAISFFLNLLLNTNPTSSIGLDDLND